MEQLLLFVIYALISPLTGSYTSPLYPYESESREVRSLDGLWKFRTSPPNNHNAGFDDIWYKKDLEKTGPCILMPVPSSYNDVTTNVAVRDYVGWVWYQRYFYVPKSWSQTKRTVLVRFGSIHYHAVVWANGDKVGEHTGGHLPFQVNITDSLKSRVRLTVAVNNTLTNLTLPQIQISHPNNPSKYPYNYVQRKQLFDFFNYAGIHRPVILIALPKVHVADIHLQTTFHLRTKNRGSLTGQVSYKISPSLASSDVKCKITILDKSEQSVAKAKGCSSAVSIPNVTLWWPRDMVINYGYLYTFRVELLADDESDVYYLPFGVRTVRWNKTKILINNVQAYLHGFGMHEDSILRGKGLDLVHLVRDFELINWLGANAFRTSHYPYSEEVLNMADKNGIMVIMESPACTIEFFGEELLKYHQQVMREIISRDKNRPSVIMWSLSNEPHTQKESSGPYFESLANLVRSLDTRPVTFVTSRTALTDKAVKYMDVVCFNRYAGWYSDSGHLELIKEQTVAELDDWFAHYQRPIIMTEYGAGSLSGFHQLPSVMYTEDYQVETMHDHFEAFNQRRNYIAGELIWNFQDFVTPQESNRPGGCMKGLFTRERQPKAAAYVVRRRYQQINNTVNWETFFSQLLSEKLDTSVKSFRYNGT